MGGTGGRYGTHNHTEIYGSGGSRIKDSRVLWNTYFNGTENCIGNYCNNMDPRMRQGD